jgi:hypothetical protein
MIRQRRRRPPSRCIWVLRPVGGIAAQHLPGVAEQGVLAGTGSSRSSRFYSGTAAARVISST